MIYHLKLESLRSIWLVFAIDFALCPMMATEYVPDFFFSLLVWEYIKVVKKFSSTKMSSMCKIKSTGEYGVFFQKFQLAKLTIRLRKEKLLDSYGNTNSKLKYLKHKKEWIWYKCPVRSWSNQLVIKIISFSSNYWQPYFRKWKDYINPTNRKYDLC